ncbi:transporter substrate-binding domain-containing protein [Kosakonia sp. BK9b]
MPAEADLPLRFAINLGNAVLATTTAQGEPGGITVEIAKKIAARMNRLPQWVTYPAAGKVVADAASGRWDIAFLAIDPKREAQLHFTAPYITIQGTLLVKADDPLRSVAEMDKPGVVINVGENAAYDLWLSRHLNHATLNRLPSSQAAIDHFLQGEGDMAAGIRQPLEKAAREAVGCRVLEDNFTEIAQAICVARQDAASFAFLHEWLAQWQQEGVIEQIIAAHMT